VGAALALGITPGPRTLRALLKICADLDARAALGPFASAASPAASVAGVTLQDALARARLLLADARGGGGGRSVEGCGGAAAGWEGSGGAGIGEEWRWDGAGEAEQLAAALLRTLAFQATFGGGGGGGSTGGGAGGALGALHGEAAPAQAGEQQLEAVAE
jgi:hypothetical protein